MRMARTKIHRVLGVALRRAAFIISHHSQTAKGHTFVACA